MHTNQALSKLFIDKQRAGKGHNDNSVKGKQTSAWRNMKSDCRKTSKQAYQTDLPQRDGFQQPTFDNEVDQRGL